MAVFAPDSVYVQTFNSDSALPVLMANDPVIDTFRTYIYGQDQVGAWPFLLCQLVSRATGRVWTDYDIHVFQTLWLFLAAFAVAALARASRLTAPALLIATLCLHPTVSHYLFVINQRNAWQVTAIFFAWLSLRRALDAHAGRRRDARGTAGDRPHARDLKAELLWPLSAFLFSLLAAWTSPLSGPALCAVFALEVLRALAVSRADSSTRENAASESPTRRMIGRVLPAAGALAAALACEQLLKANYHRHALKHFGTEFRTPVEFDWPNLSANLQAQLKLFLGYPQWPLTAVACLAAPFLVYRLVRRATRTAGVAPRGRASDATPDSNDATIIEREPATLAGDGLRLDLSALALGCLSVALVNLASTVVFSWTRLNAYGPRYLALTHLFGTLAGLFTLLLLINLHEKIYAARRRLLPALAAVVVLSTALLFPPAAKDPEYARLKEVAEEVTRRAPGGVVLGGYWDTYVFPALQPRDALTPVPAADQLLRTPWAPRQLREAEHVLVVHHVFAPSAEIETPAPYTTFGDGSAPPAVITQHGATLRLETPRWHEQHGRVFSLYRVEGGGGGGR